MKRIITCLFLAGLVSSLSMAQVIPIDDIQVYDSDGAPASPYHGETVTVTGSVFVPQLIYNVGSFYIQGATGGIKCYLAQPLNLELGDVLEVEGVVGDFQGTIEIDGPVAIWSNIPGPAPDPAIHVPEEIVADYEMVGNFVKVIGEVVEVSPPSSFYLGAGDHDLTVYIDISTGITMDGVAVGDIYWVTGPVYNYQGEIQIQPRFQDDLELESEVALEKRTWSGVKAIYR